MAAVGACLVGAAAGADGGHAAAAVRAGVAHDSSSSSTLSLQITGATVAGGVMYVVASGWNPGEDSNDYYRLYAIAVDTSVLPGPCESTYLAELTDISDTTGSGAILTPAGPLDEGSSGAFTLRIPFTAGAAGTARICAYTEDLWADDLAAASATVTVAASGSGGAGAGSGAGSGGSGSGGSGSGAGGSGVGGSGSVTGSARPLNVSAPSIGRLRQTLICAVGRWRGAVQTYRFHWQLVGARGKVAGTLPSRRQIAISARLRGHSVRCVVTAVGRSGSSSASSAAFKVR